MKNLLRYLSVIGIIMFIILLVKIDTKTLLDILLKASPFFIIIALMILALEIFVRAFKWHLLIGIFKPYSYSNALRTYLIGTAFSYVTPAKSGDFIKILDLKNRTGMDLKRGFFLSVFDKAIDTGIMIFFVIISLAISSLIFPDLRFILLPVLLLVLVGVIFSFFILNKKFRFILRFIHDYLLPERFRKKLVDLYYLSKIKTGKIIKNRVFLSYILLDTLAWVFLFLRPYLFALAIGLDVPFLYFLLFTPIVTFAEILPISIGGVGVRDISFIFLFSVLNITAESMIAVSLLIFIFNIIPLVVIGLLLTSFSKSSQ